MERNIELMVPCYATIVTKKHCSNNCEHMEIIEDKIDCVYEAYCKKFYKSLYWDKTKKTNGYKRCIGCRKYDIGPI